LMLAVLMRGQSNVAADLSGHLVVQADKRPDEVGAGEIAGESHGEMTSSRTKCSLTTFGRSASSK
jgi:hypothetical protein